MWKLYIGFYRIFGSRRGGEMPIRLVILDLDDTLIAPDGRPVEGIPEILRWLRAKELSIAIASNRDKAEGLRKIERSRLDYDLFVTRDETRTRKGSPEFILFPCRKLQVEVRESIYVGHSLYDAVTASHAKVLFLRASWAPTNVDYGIPVGTPQELREFIELYMSKTKLWFAFSNVAPHCGQSGKLYSMIDGNGAGDAQLKGLMVQVLKQQTDAQVKGRSFKDFLSRHLVASIYLSGLHEKADYWTLYPGHVKGSSNRTMQPFLELSTKLFRAKYADGLLLRHQTAQKSAYLRRSGQLAAFESQVRSVLVNPKFRESLNAKTVLVIDDFTTNGNSFEWARNVLGRAGASNVICVALGKYGDVYNSNRSPQPGRAWDPFSPCELNDADFAEHPTSFSYDKDALAEFLQSYRRWASQ
jgi:predicted amidophosphoribosyltransferase